MGAELKWRDTSGSRSQGGTGRGAATWSVQPDFLYLRDIAHDLLQPTMTILGLVEAVKYERDIPPAVLERLEEIADEARYAGDICIELLEERRLHLVVRLDQLAEATALSARTGFRGCLTVCTEPAQVLGSPVALRRAIGNLLDNACRVATESGRVEVRVASTGAEAFVEVHDSGPGFECGAPGRKQLGLAIVRRVATGHRGSVAVGGSHLGGSCVRVVMPTAEPGRTR